MKLAIIGIRGYPFTYSGFESFIASFAPCFQNKKAYDITIYNRSNYFEKKPKSVNGVSLLYIPTITLQYFETFVHSLLSTLHVCIFGKHDTIYYLGVGNSSLLLIPKLFGIKTVINVDGIDYRRKKWNILGKSYLYISEYLASVFADVVITDSIFMKNYYKTKRNTNTIYIPYSSARESKLSKKEISILFKKLNLTPNNYFLWCGRLVPDNNLYELISSYNDSDLRYKLVIVGSDLYDTVYKKKILTLCNNNKNIITLGFVDKKIYKTLIEHSAAYVETKRSSGTHPSLLDAMQSSALIVANNYPATKNILNEYALYYSYKNTNSLSKVLTMIERKLTKNNIKKYKKSVYSHYQKNYSWSKIARDYERLFDSL